MEEDNIELIDDNERDTEVIQKIKKREEESNDMDILINSLRNSYTRKEKQEEEDEEEPEEDNMDNIYEIMMRDNKYDNLEKMIKQMDNKINDLLKINQIMHRMLFVLLNR